MGFFFLRISNSFLCFLLCFDFCSCLAFWLILVLCQRLLVKSVAPATLLIRYYKKILVWIYVHFLKHKRRFLVDAQNKYHMKFCEAEGSQVIKKLWPTKNEMLLQS